MNKNQITDSLRLVFLDDILSDSLNKKFKFNKDQLISNSPRMMPPLLPIDYENPSKTISHAEFISDTLKINDASFVKAQFKENKNFDLTRLTELGYNIFDLKLYETQELEWDSIDKIAQEYYVQNNYNEYSPVLYMTKPIFNKELNLAYTRLIDGMGGMTLICEKKDKKWRVKYLIDEWVE